MKYTADHVKDFNLDHIFDCGQCFRWERQEDGSYTGTAMGKAVNMAFERGVLTIDNCTPEDYESIWRPYLDMDRDYGAIKAELSEADPTIKGACDYGYGIRILRQDFWESVVSFIISQNNNIPRIKGCIEALCAAFGERIGEYGGKEYFSIPSPEKLASLTSGDLAPIRLGYRAPYLVKAAAQFIEEGGPDAVQTRLAAAEDPIGQLQKFCGIGPKVVSVWEGLMHSP